MAARTWGLCLWAGQAVPRRDLAGYREYRSVRRPSVRHARTAVTTAVTAGLIAAGLAALSPASPATAATAIRPAPSTATRATTSAAAQAPAAQAPGAQAPGAQAPGAPGATSYLGLGRKDCLGTARDDNSRVWYTVAGGVLSDVYSPTTDNSNLSTLQYLVTDGRTFTDLQTRDMTYTVRALDRTGLACQVTATARSGRYRLITDYITDPAHGSVVMHTRYVPLTPAAWHYHVYVRYDAMINGNGGGSANGGADSATIDPSTTALVSSDTHGSSSYAPRDWTRTRPPS